jgi:hypothetical protein
VDPLVLVLIVAIGTPIGVIWGLSKSASMRGPSVRIESRRPVESLVTEAVPEELPEPDEDDDGPEFRIDEMDEDGGDGRPHSG